jgi:hypothetical protein
MTNVEILILGKLWLKPVKIYGLTLPWHIVNYTSFIHYPHRQQILPATGHIYDITRIWIKIILQLHKKLE